jgi:uncharacterized protein YdaU (DUF1376 family)
MSAEPRPGRPRYSKWFWKDFIAKIQDLSTLEVGAYVRLLGYAVTCSPDYCSIPDDEALLARASGAGLKQWRRIGPHVRPKFRLQVEGEPHVVVEGRPRLVNERALQDALDWVQVCEYQRLRRTAGQPGYDRMPSTRARARSQKSEVRSQKEEEEPSKNGGVTAACLARLRSRFPNLDLPVIEAKMLAAHAQHAYRSLDRAMVNWCKKAENEGWDAARTDARISPEEWARQEEAREAKRPQ